MIKLINILKETENSLTKLDKEISNLFNSGKFDNYSDFIKAIQIMCSNFGVNYNDYLEWLKNKHKNNEN